MQWTTEKILNLSPNPNTSKRGQALANTSKWLALATNGRLAWGECKGSSAALYKTAVDLQGPAFKCNCPSRQFPCKHGLGLMLLAHSDTDGFQVTEDLPETLQEWLEKRDAKTQKASPPDKPEDVEKQQEAKNKRFLARMALMQQGVKDLELWLHDLVRVGLATVDDGRPALVSSQTHTRIESPPDIWENMAKRMVDAKLPDIGRRIREIALVPTSSTDWGSQVLEELSELHLFIKGFQQMEELPNPLQEELLRLAGIRTNSSEVLAQQGLNDLWMVMGQVETSNVDQAKVRRTWFLSQNSGRYALIIEYDYGMGFEHHWPKGSIFQGAMVFYPGLLPLRALMKDYVISGQMEEPWDGYLDINQFLSDFASHLRQQPWLKDFPVALMQVVPQIEDGILYLIDQQGRALPLLESKLNNWKIMALSGGHPIAVFGEWTGQALNPLAVMDGTRYVPL